MSDWNRVELKNNDIYFIKITEVQPHEETKVKNSIGESKIRVHINKKAKEREAQEIIDIIAMDKENVWGVLQMGILTDGSAILGARTLDHIKYLPQEAEDVVDYNFIFNNDAIAILNEYRGTGKGKQLLVAALTLCKARNINTLNVVGIVSEEAYKFYSATGATMIDQSSAVYENILGEKYKTCDELEQ